MSLRVDHEACTLCGRCVEACPYGALKEADGHLRATEQCNLCGACIEECPVGALALEAQEGERGGATAGGGVWVYGEHQAGRFHPVVRELVGKGAELAAARDCALEVVAAGGDAEALAAQLAGLPVAALRVAAHPALDDHRDGPHARVLARMIAKGRPEIVLAGATARGRSLMPRVAVLCRTGLTADCTGLEIEPEQRLLLQTRPAFGGNIMATILTRRHRPQMATVRPRVMAVAAARDGRPPPVRRWRPPDELLDDPVEVMGREERAEEGVSIAEADVLVAGGRGLGGPEGFDLLRELADLLGGEVAASRAAVDAGWIPYSRQVGQTGKTVQPDVYVAVGISGAVQHRAGMQSAGTIVAVNSDPQAPIFQISDYAAVGDYRPVLTALVELLRREAAHE